MRHLAVRAILAMVMIHVFGLLSAGAQVQNPEAAASYRIEVDEVDRAKPFGDLDVSTVERMTAEQRTELSARCRVIKENPDRFNVEAGAFCEEYDSKDQ